MIAEKLWAVNIPEEADSATILYPVPSQKIGKQLVYRLKKEAMQQFPHFGEVIADAVSIEEWNGSPGEHAKYILEHKNWWNEETFLEPSHD